MCGIYGVVGSTDINEVLTKLQRLEYRGYDSCGIAYMNDNICYLAKSVGNTALLRKEVINSKVQMAIGHTRWATHGLVNKTNAHPHVSSKNRFYVVHNGVIDNYLYLKNKYGFTMASTTDSEIVVHLLDYYINRFTIIEALKLIMIELEGSFAIVIMDNEDKNNLFFLKNKSPLLLGVSNNKVSLASDQLAFDNNANIIILNDNNYGLITNNSYQIFSLGNNERWNSYYKNDDIRDLCINDSYMLNEILYQPRMILNIANNYKKIDTLSFIDLLNGYDEIIFVGAGSSYYASRILRDFYESKLNKRCYSVIASELKNFNIINKNVIFIFLSQSGETADLCDCLYYLKDKGYKIVSLCNNINSQLGFNSDLVFPLFANAEIAVASTKALLAMIYVGKLLIDSSYLDNSSLISNQIQNVINKWDLIHNYSKDVSKAKAVFYLGKSNDYNISLEGALKLREISYIHSFAFQSGELKHGSIALIDNEVMCIGVLSNPSLCSYIKNNLEEVRSRGAKTILISNCDSNSDIFIDGDELNIVVCLQIIAYQTAKLLNRNIDQPRNLAKSVTVL